MIFGVGIHGQFLFVDRAKKLAVAWFASQNSPLDSPPLKKRLRRFKKFARWSIEDGKRNDVITRFCIGPRLQHRQASRCWEN